MIKELEIDYEITVDNMIPMTDEQGNNEYSVYQSEFYNRHGQKAMMNVLLNKDGTRQIFQKSSINLMTSKLITFSIIFFW
jgi:hypothetical protein